MVTFHTHRTVRPIPLFISYYDRAPFPNPRAPNSESKVSINSMAVLSLRRRVLQHRAHERITAFKPFQIKVFQVMRKKLITKLKQFSKWQLRLHFFTKKCFCLLSLVCCALAVWETATPPTRVTILIYNVMLFLMGKFVLFFVLFTLQFKYRLKKRRCRWCAWGLGFKPTATGW